MLDIKVCQKARLSRDPRFDGKFFTAVKTTGIYCRTICPVHPPKEQNVVYFASAIECANAGFRPCLRCRPDSAPHSPAWKGVNATLDRATRLIDEGGLQESTLESLAARLGISDRYLRQLFKKHLAMSPKSYALYQQCLFAKQLLQQTKLAISQVALASGFESVRRFNDCFKKQLKLTPSMMRKSSLTRTNNLTIKIYYRPPFDWPLMQKTLATRAIDKLEWCDQNSYGRSFNWQGCIGSFTAIHNAAKHLFDVKIQLCDLRYLRAIVNNIKRILDVNVDIQAVEQDLQACLPDTFAFKKGVRIPGVWNMFEAGIRAILGQQISVVAARNLVTTLVAEIGERDGNNYLFPTAKAIANSQLNFLNIPGSRKQTLRNLAQHYLNAQNICQKNIESQNTHLKNVNLKTDGDQTRIHDNQTIPDQPEDWLQLKGIGPWTVDYARMRGQSDPDIFLGGDLGIKKALGQSSQQFDPIKASPWRSYLTFQLWSQL